MRRLASFARTFPLPCETVLVLAMCTAGWAAMLAAHANGSGGHVSHAVAEGGAVRVGMDGAVATLAAWAAMTLAMVPAAAHGMARRVATRALPHRRFRSALLFLLPHWGAWLVAGIACLPIAMLLRFVFGPRAATAMAVAVFAVWLFSRARLTALRRCHASAALRIAGSRADVDAMLFGLAHGRRCVLACGPLMLVATVAQAGLVGMAAATWAMIAERRRIDPTPNASLAAVALIVTLSLA